MKKKKIIIFIKNNQKIRFVNDDFFDLVSNMLCIYPSDRINAEEALKHPWFVNNVV